MTDPFKLNPSRKEDLTDKEIKAIRDLYEHFVGETYETDNGTTYKMTSAQIKDGEPHVMMVPLNENGNEVRVNKRYHHLAEFKRRFMP